MHGVTEAVIACLPVVHWQTVSLAEQPEPWTAVAKQEICNAANTVSSAPVSLLLCICKMDLFMALGAGGIDYAMEDDLFQDFRLEKD